jgi:hypothetical protein
MDGLRPLILFFLRILISRLRASAHHEQTIKFKLKIRLRTIRAVGHFDCTQPREPVPVRATEAVRSHNSVARIVTLLLLVAPALFRTVSVTVYAPGRM